MKLQNICLLLLCALVVSCASTRPTELTNYDTQLIAPEVIGEYILKDKEVFEEPSLGAMLRYENREFPEDNITIYVYPINAISWENKSSTMQSEMSHALSDIDAAIQYGYYKSRTKELVSDFAFKSQGKEFSGKKAEFSITTNNDVFLYSDVYMFLAEDKYIKFRTSFDGRSTNRSMGNETVKNLLPQLTIPPESIYMKKIRADHEKKIQQQLMHIIEQSLESAKG